LLPRLVSAGNFSRIGLARVIFSRRRAPVGVERLGVVLEPQAPYELNGRSGGGVEDPRVTYLAARGQYVMLYTAFGPAGPRIAAAVSRDLLHWRRYGLVRFSPSHDVNLAHYENKDGLLFPEPVRAPDGRPALALIHRPGYPTRPDATADKPLPPRPAGGRLSMWISYAPLDEIVTHRHIVFGQHHLLATPERSWEHLRVGGGAPPVRLANGWLVLYHGVSGHLMEGVEQHQEAHYRAGALLLDLADPRQVVYRTARSILDPRTASERVGVAPRVVFPTGTDARGDGTLDIYYGMADSRIGVVRAYLAGILARCEGHAA
jgi:predicted GH43/DUF377 family glycosyl hydrolase